eukprot:50501-Alexandrium_andersonii.AAC.1
MSTAHGRDALEDFLEAKCGAGHVEHVLAHALAVVRPPVARLKDAVPRMDFKRLVPLSATFCANRRRGWARTCRSRWGGSQPTPSDSPTGSGPPSRRTNGHAP